MGFGWLPTGGPLAGTRRRILAYWAGFAAILILAGVPVAVLSATAPSTQVEDGAGISRPARAISVDGAASPAGGSPSPDGRAPSPASAATPPHEVIASVRQPSAAPAPRGGEPGLDAGFEIQCWPDLDVLPGRGASVDCTIPLLNGYTGEISLACRVAGMTCAMNPERVVAGSDRNAVSSRLTVTAPGSAPVGMVLASVSATGGETGSALKRTDVRVNVPPPFLVRCESVGASFVKGEDVSMNCWISFHDGFDDAVALKIVDASGVPAALDTQVMAAAPNQTRAFKIDIGTASLAAGLHSIKVGVSSNRYLQEATAVFSVSPAA